MFLTRLEKEKWAPYPSILLSIGRCLHYAEMSGRHPEIVIRTSRILGISGNLGHRQFSSVASQSEGVSEIDKKE